MSRSNRLRAVRARRGWRALRTVYDDGRTERLVDFLTDALHDSGGTLDVERWARLARFNYDTERDGKRLSGAPDEMLRVLRESLGEYREGIDGGPDAYRIVVALEVDVQTVADAYARLHKHLGALEAETRGLVQWESTDEWYDSWGDEIPTETVEEIRGAHFESQERTGSR